MPKTQSTSLYSAPIRKQQHDTPSRIGMFLRLRDRVSRLRKPDYLEVVLMEYPSPAEWMRHAIHARLMANAYRREGNDRKANQRDADAEFYADRAELEEWRLAQINEHPEAA